MAIGESPLRLSFRVWRPRPAVDTASRLEGLEGTHFPLMPLCQRLEEPGAVGIKGGGGGSTANKKVPPVLVVSTLTADRRQLAPYGRQWAVTGGSYRIGFGDALPEPQHLSPLAAVGRPTRQCTAHGG